jgi:ABC-type proline/glycine betaine transport system ATPase subunit
VREAIFLGTRIALLAAGRLVGEYAPNEFLHSTEPEARAFAASYHLGPEEEEVR